jgi:RNA recognition motif. (a.k.a. RRM, RBD, or RNP domain)
VRLEALFVQNQALVSDQALLQAHTCVSSLEPPGINPADQWYRKLQIIQNRTQRPPKGDVDSQWSHDLYESHNSLSARLGNEPTAPKAALNNLAARALREATGAGGRTSPGGDQLSIRGASSKGNVVDVSGLAGGTTAEDVAAIFKQCGAITEQRLMDGGENPRVRLHFKTVAAASSAISKFHNQPADGKVLQVTVVGVSTAGASLASRFGTDGMDLVRQEGSVDVLMDTDSNGGS